MLTSIDDYEIFKSEVQDLGIDISGKIIPYFDVASVTGQTPLRGEDQCYLCEMSEEINMAIYGVAPTSFYPFELYKRIKTSVFKSVHSLFATYLIGMAIKEDYCFEEVESIKHLTFNAAYSEAKKIFDSRLDLMYNFGIHGKIDEKKLFAVSVLRSLAGQKIYNLP